MNYIKIHNQFIESRKSIDHGFGYFEKHHIIPKSHGGTNSIENIIKLTARDHFFVHLLLAKIYGGGMNIAIWRMCHPRSQGYKSRKKITSRQFESLRLKFIGEMSARFKGKKRPKYIGEKTSKALKGMVRSDEAKARMKKAQAGKTMPKFTEEWKSNMAKSKIGPSNPMYGKPSSEKQKKSVSEANSGTKSHRYNKNVFSFVHQDGIKRMCTQHDLRIEFGLRHGNLSLMCSGKRNFCSGWRINNEQ
jgi:hypothetical protein